MTLLTKKILSILCIISILTTFSLFALASSDSSTVDDQGSGSASTQNNVDNQGNGMASSQNNETVDENANNLGDYKIDIQGCRLATDYQNKPIVIVKYSFTNYSSDAVSFSVAIDDEVFQNGIGLNHSYVVNESANFSSDNQSKQIKSGVTIEVEVAYELNDTTTDIDVEVTEYFSFNDQVVKKTFKISDQNSNAQTANTAETTASISNLGDYYIEIKSCRLATDYDKKPIVIVKYSFTNNSNDSVAFYLAVSDNVYQNGIGLNKSYFVNESANYSSDNHSKQIKTGATIEVEVAYELNDTTTDIEVEVTKLISFNDTVIRKTFKIAE